MPATAPRVVLATRGGLPGALVLDRLLRSRRVTVAGIVLSTRVEGPHAGWIAGALRHIRRSGLGYATYLFAATTLADAASRFGPLGSVASRARRERIALHSTRGVDSPDGVAFVQRCAPDLLVSAFFDQRIVPSVAALARLGAVNIHPSALPDLRGVDPVFRAMQRRHGTLGVSIHRVTPEWDAGPLLASATSPREPGESVLGATGRLYDQGAALLLGSLDSILSGHPGATQEGEGCYDSWPARSDSAMLAKMGVKLARPADLWRRAGASADTR